MLHSQEMLTEEKKKNYQISTECSNCERQKEKKDRTCSYIEVLQIRKKAGLLKTVFLFLNLLNAKNQARDLTFFFTKTQAKAQIHVSHTTKNSKQKEITTV